MADPAFVAVGTHVQTGTLGASVTPPLPAGWSAGETAVLITVVSNFGTGSLAPTLVNPPGWSQHPELHADGFANTRNPRLRILTRVLQAGDTAPSVSMTGGNDAGTGSNHLLAYIFTVADADSVTSGVGAIGDTSAVSVPSVNTTYSNGLIVGVVATGNSVTTTAHSTTSPGALTERADVSHPSRVSAAVATGTKGTLGATGNYTATLSANTPWAGVLLAFAPPAPAAFPFSPLLDDFNRADAATLGSNWSADTLAFGSSSLQIISGTAGRTSGSNGSNYWNASQFGPDCEVYARVVALTTSTDIIRLFYRMQSPATTGVDGYYLSVTNGSPDSWQLWRVDNQSLTTVGAAFTHDLVAGDSIGVSVIGDQHHIYHKTDTGSWTLKATRTDATYNLAGYIGLFVGGTAGRIGEFGGGTRSTAGIPGAFDVPMAVTTLTSLTSWVDIDSLAAVDVDVPVSARTGETTLPPPGEPSGDPQRWALDITNRAGVVVAQFEPQSFKVTDTLNVGMSMEGTALADAVGASSLAVQERVVRAWRRSGGSPVGFERTLRFAGHIHAPLTDTGDENGEEAVTFVARDPFAALTWRLAWSHLSLGTDANDELDIGVVASELVGFATEYAPEGAGLPSVSDHGLRVSQIQPSVAGAFSYDPGKQIAEAIKELTELERGFWFRVEAQEGAAFGGMRIYYPNPGVERPAARFEYGRKTLGNLASFRVDTQMVINGATVFGGNNLMVKVYDEDSIDQYGLWEISLSFPDVYAPNVLRALGSEALRPDPVQTISCEVASGGPATPMLWDSFNVGDSVPLYIRADRVNVDRMVTVTSATVSVDENGDEQLTNLVLEAR